MRKIKGKVELQNRLRNDRNMYTRSPTNIAVLPTRRNKKVCSFERLLSSITRSFAEKSRKNALFTFLSSQHHHTWARSERICIIVRKLHETSRAVIYCARRAGVHMQDMCSSCGSVGAICVRARARSRTSQRYTVATG